MVPPEIEADFSLLNGLKFACLDGCGYCCLFQPDLNHDEMARLNDMGLSWAITKRHFSGSSAIKMQGNGGACVFLKGGRCTIYSDRPHFCREFPFHIYLGERLQVIPNLSCRGLWPDFSDRKYLMPVQSAYDAALPFVKEIGADMLAGPKETFSSFHRELDKHGTGCPKPLLCEIAEAVKELLTDYRGIASVLEFSWEYSGEPIAADEILYKLRGWTPETDLKEEAMLGVQDALGLENPANLPVYVDERLNWNLFQVSGNRITQRKMTEKGAGRTLNSIPLDSVPLPELDGEALSLLMDYIDILLKRDSFYGYVAYLVSDGGFEDSLLNAYLGTLATSVLDLLWRASMLHRFEGGGKKIGRRELLNGIVFYDGEILDAPALGEFV